MVLVVVYILVRMMVRILTFLVFFTVFAWIFHVGLLFFLDVSSIRYTYYVSEKFSGELAELCFERIQAPRWEVLTYVL